MMALQGDFYIPQCDREKCNDYLKVLAQKLKKQDANLVLVTQDPPYESIEKSFMKSYNSCAFTIIHKCRAFWEKIQSLENTLLKEKEGRIICVTFRHDRRESYEQIERHHAFFKRLRILEVSNDSLLKSFVETALESLHKKYPDRGKLHEVQEEGDDTSDEEEDRFERLPDLFEAAKPPDVFVLKSFMKLSDKSPLQNCSNVGKWAKFAQEAKDIVSLPILKCCFLKVLPKIYSNKDLVGLVFLSVCGHQQMASMAVLMLQLLLFKNQSSKPSERINELIVAESLLWRELAKRRHGTASTGSGNSIFFSRLAVTYVMVICDFLLICVKENKTCTADTHLDTIDGRSLPRRAPDDIIMSNICNWFDKFVKDLVQRKCKTYKAMLQTIELEQDQDSESESEEDKIIVNQPSAIQALWAFQKTREIFQSMSEDHLSFAAEFVQKEGGVDASTAIIFQGLALLVVFQLKTAAVEDVEKFCKKTMDILKYQLPPTSAKIRKGTKVDPLLQMLFFNQNPFIRTAIMEITWEKEKSEGKKKSEEKRKHLFLTNKKEFIENEVLRLLYPLMSEDVSIVRQDKLSGENWMLYEVNFGESKAHLRLHLPELQDPNKLKKDPNKLKKDPNKLKTCGYQDVWYNEMITLAELQHENIIKMFAYQKQHIPQFYVVEHHPNLQSALKNKFKNNAFDTKSMLMKYLGQALEALKFCHSREFLHCNLTAESLLLVNDDKVKLSGFHLCLKIKFGEALREAHTKEMIPTRWSAPESLKSNNYSVASDVWMFGHLMYEVLTHGGLPYADIEEEDSELLKKLQDVDVHLTEHRLIQREHFDLISWCTKALPEERPNLTHIQEALKLREVSMDSIREDQVNFDDFEEVHKPSTDHGKGIPTNAGSVLMMDMSDCSQVDNVVLVSDTVTKTTKGHRYLFTEKLVNMSQEVRIQLRNGALAHILPYISIKESPQTMAHAECIIQRLQSTSQSCGAQLNSQPVDKNVDESLEKVALDKLLGCSIKTYLECLYQAALLLEKLHLESWTVGDISMPLLHVQQEIPDKVLKVYLISVANLQKYNSKTDSEGFSDINAITEKQKDSLLISRAAPEVVEFGMFSPGSDIYCFGNLMWQTLKTFDCPANMRSAFMKEQREVANFTSPKVSEKWEVSHKKPSCCSTELYDLMRDCTHHNSSARISINQLAQELRRIIQMM